MYEWNLMGQVHPQSCLRVSDWDAKRDNRLALWGQWKSHVSKWAFPDPRVRDVKSHNTVITWQNLNKPVILTSLLSTFPGKWLMSGPLECVYRQPSTWQNHRRIYELLSPVTSKVMLISSEEAAAVCVLSIILILASTEGKVLIATSPISCFQQHVKCTLYQYFIILLPDCPYMSFSKQGLSNHILATVSWHGRSSFFGFLHILKPGAIPGYLKEVAHVG